MDPSHPSRKWGWKRFFPLCTSVGKFEKIEEPDHDNNRQVKKRRKWEEINPNFRRVRHPYNR